MSEVISLSSDSNDSENDAPEIGKDDSSNNVPNKHNHASDDDDDLMLPEVPFSYTTNAFRKRSVDKYPDVLPTTSASSSSDARIEEELLAKYFSVQASTSGSSRDDRTEYGSSFDDRTTSKVHRGNKSSAKDRERLRAERIAKQEEAARQKALKAATAENLKSVKPGECMKFLTVLVDSEITNSAFCPKVLLALQTSGIKYNVESQKIPNSIAWMRDVREHYVNERHEVCERSETQEENHTIIIWSCEEVVRKVADRTFADSIGNVSKLTCGKRITLVTYGMEEYFRHHKNLKKRAVRQEALGKEKSNRRSESCRLFDGFPRISKSELELCLTEVQLTLDCNHRYMENAEDLGLLICQYSKAIAEAPFKMEKTRKLGDKLDWYASGDNKDCVRVDKDGNGLIRLWQQQLCQFNMVSLETAEAIASNYPSPLCLMEAYQNCTPAQGEKLLQDIPIRRAAGPLTTARKIGPVLSKQMYVMFTSVNGEELLDND